MRAVDHVHDQVGVGDFLQRGFERFDELRWQAAHETDGVHIRVQSPVLGFRTAYGGIKVANSAFSTSSAEPVSRLVNDDLPAFV